MESFHASPMQGSKVGGVIYYLQPTPTDHQTKQEKLVGFLRDRSETLQQTWGDFWRSFIHATAVQSRVQILGMRA